VATLNLHTPTGLLQNTLQRHVQTFSVAFLLLRLLLRLRLLTPQQQ
jgi:hypothetical protein